MRVQKCQFESIVAGSDRRFSKIMIKIAQNITLTLFAIALSIWSGNIAEGAGGLWFVGVLPVAGWLVCSSESEYMADERCKRRGCRDSVS